MESRFTLGLDIGIASVGWCLLGEKRIIDLGVRAFDKAETAKEGDPLNLTRRMARLARHRLAQRAWRLKKLTRELKRHGLIDDKRFFLPGNPTAKSPWHLRVEGLERLLNREEWARVIYHLCKHRGFHWVSRAEEKQAEGDTKSESGQVKQALAGTKRLMGEKKYRSVAEMVLREFPDAQRNKQGEYTKALSRALLGDELKKLFDHQRQFGNPFAGQELEIAIIGQGDRKSGLFWQQKPPLSGAALLKMLGKCTFEKAEFRAPKASFTAERHVWLTRLNNLRIVHDGTTRPLNEQERALALPLPYKQAGNFTYKQLANALDKAGLLSKDAFRFAGLSYPSDKQKTEGKAKDPEGDTLVKLPAWQELATALKKAGLETEWEGIAGAALNGQPEILDEIARVLSVYKDDDETRAELNRLALPNREKMVEALLDFPRVSFSRFHALSLKALYKIVPFMEPGQRYDEACVSAGYLHSQLFNSSDEKELYLPPFYEQSRGHKRGEEGRMIFSERIESEITGGIPRNPVVLRALNQARKVVNAIIKKYGSPMAVNIEMARDLSRPLQGHKTASGNYIEGRRDIEVKQKEYQAQNERDKNLFAEQFGQQPQRGEFDKFRLYREQLGKCAYSLEAIDLERLLEPGYVEIDHALPYSRSFDDSKNNKVLVFAKENRNKGNQTPYEYLCGAENAPRWQQFVAFVESSKAYRLAKRSRLLRKEFGEKEAEEFKERNLNDTRYICKFFKNYVERYLKLAEGSEVKRCVVLSGQTTAFLRARWGFNKIRSESDRHHALDAAVVAACTHGMVKRLADYSRTKELAQVHDGFIDTTTGEIVNPAMFQQLKQHFPEPWPYFRHELEARLKIDDSALLREEMMHLGTYDEAAMEALHPLFVSRAVQKRGTGAVHEETIRSAKLIHNNQSYVKTPVEKLRLANLSNVVGASDPRNKVLMDLLAKRLEDFDDDGKKAFATPIRKPANSGLGPVVRTVKILTTQKNGVRVRGGLADLGEMQAVGVFKAGKGYFIDPEYLAAPNVRISSATVPQDAEFLFYLRKNDYLEIQLGETTCRGYFVMYESDGRLTLRAHDQPKPDKGYFRKSVSNAQLIRKFFVDILGNIHPTKPEPRRGLA